jgi:hypothetical protein
MRSQLDARELDVFEQCAQSRLAPILGLLRQVDPGGGPTPLHDFEADLADGSVAVVEVTAEVDSDRLRREAAAARLLSSLSVPGSRFRWLVGLDARAHVKAINKTALCRLLLDTERQGERSVNSRGDYRDPLVCRARKLRISYIYSFATTGPGQGAIMIGPDFHGGCGWNGLAIGAWLADFLVSRQGRNKLYKLSQVRGAAQRHLVVILHPFSKAGLCIPVGLTDLEEPGAADAAMPSFVPPAAVTDLWLLPMVSTWLGLHWTRGSGWSAVRPDPDSVTL